MGKQADFSYPSDGCGLGSNMKNVDMLANDGDATAGPCFALLLW